MSDETTGTGQAVSEPASGSETTPAAGTESPKGQPAASQGTTGQEPAEDVIFDPVEYDRLAKDLPQDLKAQVDAFKKSLQGNYTKKTQELAKNRQKVDAYDAFYRDPVTQIQTMAKQLGYTLTRAQAQDMAENQPAQQPGAEWEPKSWNEVLQRSKELAMKEIMGQLGPVFNELQSSKKTAIEKQLTEIDPTWHQYEDEMVSNLTAHPTLAKDPIMLYRLSVPPEVFESRATQRALAKLENKASQSKISGQSTTTKTPKEGMPDGPVSFAEAVRIAKAKLEAEGIRPGG